MLLIFSLGSQPYPKVQGITLGRGHPLLYPMDLLCSIATQGPVVSVLKESKHLDNFRARMLAFTLGLPAIDYKWELFLQLRYRILVPDTNKLSILC